ncbi:MAG: TetR/AcrR family transcriptional regulator [Bacteroidota bacterium]
MCPRTSEQFEEIREVKRRQIMDAAIECFATTGYHAVSISELARHAAISKGLMYNYFKSKEDLLKCIFKEVMAEMMRLIDPDESGELELKALVQYFERLFHHLESNILLWKMYMAIFSQPAVQLILSDEIQAASSEPLMMVERYFIKEGYKNPALEVAFLSTLVSGATWEYLADPEHYPLDDVKKRILSFYQ